MPAVFLVPLGREHLVSLSPGKAATWVAGVAGSDPAREHGSTLSRRPAPSLCIPTGPC